MELIVLKGSFLIFVVFVWLCRLVSGCSGLWLLVRVLSSRVVLVSSMMMLIFF